MRHKMFFKQDAGPYKAGKWYDNVPQDDTDFALDKGIGVVCAFAECGCLMADTRVVHVSADCNAGHGPPVKAGPKLLRELAGG